MCSEMNIFFLTTSEHVLRWTGGSRSRRGTARKAETYKWKGGTLNTRSLGDMGEMPPIEPTLCEALGSSLKSSMTLQCTSL